MRPVIFVSSALALLVGVGSVSAQTTPPFRGASILNSKHDLSALDTTNGEVCVFCHTPHGADTAAPAPLWNRSLAGPTDGQGNPIAYNRYSSLGTSTLDGEEAAVGSVSLACLSCHDGTQAMDSVINAPGSGGYNAAGAVIGGGAGTFMTGAPIPMLGTDLTDDHPISIEYAGGACTSFAAGTACDPATQATGDPDFAPAQQATINGQTQWWVDVASFSLNRAGTETGTGTAGAREKTDMILYTRTFGGGSGPSVECASCHDPHEAELRPVSFLRISNRDSGVCLACHVK